MSFESDVAAYFQQESVQKQFRKHATQMMKSGAAGGTGGLVACKEDAMKYAEEAKKCIIDSLPDSLKSGSAHPITESALICSPVTVDDDGNFVIEMGWDPNAVHRNSLYDDYDDDVFDAGDNSSGIADIVRLFANGYKARNYVYGWWDGHSPKYAYDLRNAHGIATKASYSWATSCIQRDADPFLQQAAADFNALHKKDNVRLGIKAGYLT